MPSSALLPWSRCWDGLLEDILRPGTWRLLREQDTRGGRTGLHPRQCPPSPQQGGNETQDGRAAVPGLMEGSEGAALLLSGPQAVAA